MKPLYLKKNGTVTKVTGSGRGIASVAINSSNHLIITYTDGTTSDAGEVPAGQDGNNTQY